MQNVFPYYLKLSYNTSVTDWRTYRRTTTHTNSSNVT